VISIEGLVVIRISAFHSIASHLMYSKSAIDIHV
jgi:hypothetical protein